MSKKLSNFHDSVVSIVQGKSVILNFLFYDNWETRHLRTIEGYSYVIRADHSKNIVKSSKTDVGLEIVSPLRTHRLRSLSLY